MIQHGLMRNLRRLCWVGLAIAVLFWTVTLGHAQTPTPSPAPIPETVVQLDHQPLFPIQAQVGSFSAAERAQIISKRLEALAKDESVAISSLRITSQAEITEIVTNGTVLVTLTEGDAKAAEKNRQQLANDHVKTIKDAVNAYRRTHGSQGLLFSGAYAAAATIVLFVFLAIIGWIFPKLYAQLERWKGTRVRAIKIQNLELLSEDQIVNVLIGFIKILRQPLVLAILYLYLLLILSFFPQTRSVATDLFDYLKLALNVFWQGFLSYLPNMAVVIVIALFTSYLIKIVRLILSAIENGIIGFPGFYQEWARPTYQIARLLILTVALAISVPYLPGSGSPAIQGLSFFLGIFVSLGATAVIANVFAGIALTYTRAFRIGDRVQIADTTGDVLEKTFLVTRVRTPKNVVVTIPNSMVLANHIVNFSDSDQAAGLILHTKITLGYDIPWPRVHEILIAAAQATHHVLVDPPPFVLQTSLDDFYVSYELNAYTDRPTQMQRIYSELHQNIQDRCNESQLEILSPHFSAIRDGNPINIPQDYLPKNYQAPGFRVHPLENIFSTGQPNTYSGKTTNQDKSQGESV